jgi:hypothetical protein
MKVSHRIDVQASSDRGLQQAWRRRDTVPTAGPDEGTDATAWLGPTYRRIICFLDSIRARHLSPEGASDQYRQLPGADST